MADEAPDVNIDIEIDESTPAEVLEVPVEAAPETESAPAETEDSQ